MNAPDHKLLSMLRAGLPERAILQRMEMAKMSLAERTAKLAELKQQLADEQPDTADGDPAPTNEPAPLSPNEATYLRLLKSGLRDEVVLRRMETDRVPAADRDALLASLRRRLAGDK